MVMALTVRCRKTDPRASPAALVAAWLFDALNGLQNIGLTWSDAELVLTDDSTAETSGPVRSLVDTTLAEARFAGWELACE